MKKLTIMLLLFYPLLSYTQTWQWAKKAIGTGLDSGEDIISDMNGNVYIAGRYSGTSLNFGNTTISNVSGLDFDFYLAKFDANGNNLWAVGGGGQSRDEAYSVSTDASGNVYMAGNFKSQTILIGNTTLVRSQLYDIFIAKFSSSGTLMWAKSFGGTGNDYIGGICTDKNNNVYLTGNFGSDTIAFGSSTLVNVNCCFGDIFLAKLDSSGNAKWAISAGGTVSDIGTAISSDNNGNIYLASAFDSPSIVVGNSTYVCQGFSDMFVSKVDTSGNIKWVQSFSSPGDEIPFSIASDQAGNVYLTGFYWISPITFGTTTLANAGDQDMFLVKMDSSGGVLWANGAGGPNRDRGFGVDVDAAGNVFVGGDFLSQNMNFGSTQVNNSSGSEEIFIGKYDSGGGLTWASTISGANVDNLHGLATTGNGSLLVSGSFVSPNLTFGSQTLNASGSIDLFLAKLSANTGINETLGQKQLRIYPNPVTETFKLIFDNSIQDIDMLIENVLGQIVTVIPDATQDMFSVKEMKLVPGVYFLTLTKDSEQLANCKFIVTNE
ncbi:MAG: T9SS type A sorting domain-containing protein [Bacteroidia bacterium]